MEILLSLMEMVIALACFSATCSLFLVCLGFFLLLRGILSKNHLDDLVLLLQRTLSCSYWLLIKASCFLL